jgi:hypothetical protein
MQTSRHEQPLTMDRRQLLATAAAIPMRGILPPQVSIDAVNAVEAVHMPGPTSEATSLNVCAVTARRIEEIAARNQIRQEAWLPLLSIPKELRRMKEATDAAQFEAFAHAHRGAVWARMLAAKRAARDEPNWQPSRWMEGLRLNPIESLIREQKTASSVTT